MGERKVLNKYYPPNFDPKNIPRLRKQKNQQKKIRFMLPVMVRCNTCGNYMYQGTKFNSREEEVIGEAYLGIKIHRFYINCTKCSAEVTIKTDPKNSGYIVESGGTCRYNGQEEEEEEHVETESIMESLEKRSMVSKRQIEVMAAIDEMICMKSRRASISVDSMLEGLSRRKEEEEEENEALIKSIKFGKRTRMDDEEVKKPKKTKSCKSPLQISSVRIISKKIQPMGLESLCQTYTTDSDDDDN